jgi:hypothetical protein
MPTAMAIASNNHVSSDGDSSILGDSDRDRDKDSNCSGNGLQRSYKNGHGSANEGPNNKIYLVRAVPIPGWPFVCRAGAPAQPKYQ